MSLVDPRLGCSNSSPRRLGSSPEMMPIARASC